ncbi:MAG: ADP-ribosylation factor-like protein [Myxococcales bacterium]|nr:ADP-ribosylation factor-like protein [Polyangiaceae bacterium]MDW8250468.1 ADP-ribosylation factor-like protein [Myxococcales bacterium]
MATYDPSTGTITLRIVFDGLGMAGKTTNIRQVYEILSSSRRGDLYVPEERRGRTLYFDWLEIEAGMLGESRVRCQLLTVPGQFSYVQRRFHLLSSPDAIIVVIDSTPQGLVRARYALRFLQEAIASHLPPVPLVFQANKQDLEGALPGHEVAQILELPQGTRVVEASAIQGSGVRSTLVFALQAARERLQRQLQEAGLEALPVGTESAEEVYHQLLRQETEGVEAKEGEILADRVLQQLEGTPVPPSIQTLSSTSVTTSSSPFFPPGAPEPVAPSPVPATPLATVDTPSAAPTPAPDGFPLLILPAAGRIDLQIAEQEGGGIWNLHRVYPGEEPLTELRAGGWSQVFYAAWVHPDRRQGALVMRELAEARLAVGDLLPVPWNLLLQEVEGGVQPRVLRRTLEPAFPGEISGEEVDAALEELATYTARALTLAARHGVVLPLDPALLGRGPHGLVSLAIPLPISRWGSGILAPLARWCAYHAQGKGLQGRAQFLSRVEARVADPQDPIKLNWGQMTQGMAWH